jgi:hypothetical protein
MSQAAASQGQTGSPDHTGAPDQTAAPDLGGVPDPDGVPDLGGGAGQGALPDHRAVRDHRGGREPAAVLDAGPVLLDGGLATELEAAGHDLSGTLWPLIIPLAFGDAFSIFLLRQFLMTIPNEYVDAAKVDGCGDLRTLLKVVIPMAKPGIAAVALFQFFYAWNDYFGPQIYASENPGAWTLSYGLSTFKSAHHTNWNFTMAATLLVMAPVILLFFLAQRAFIEGVTLTGVKG